MSVQERDLDGTPVVGVTVDAACRAVDLVLGVVLLILLLPVLLLVGLAIRLDTRGPALFRQGRIGRDQEPFTVHKFRTMRHGVAHDVHREYVRRLIAGEEPDQDRDENGQRFKMTADDRVTRLGRFLRRTSLDELPQLWNVVRGDMSLVGPRPPIPYEVAAYPPHWFARFAVKPGMTGLWQVSGRSRLSLEEMIRLDVEYVERRSVWLNLGILLRTIPVVLIARGAS